MVLGRWARLAIERQLGLHGARVVGGPIHVGQRDRLVAFLPHPNARAAARRLRKAHSFDQLRRVYAQALDETESAP